MYRMGRAGGGGRLKGDGLVLGIDWRGRVAGEGHR